MPIAELMAKLSTPAHVIAATDEPIQLATATMNETHPAKLLPSPMGHSIAHYEGDALVVDTIGIKLAPYTVVDRFGTPQSEVMHVIERYRLIDADEARAAQERHEKTAGRTGGKEGNWPFDSGENGGLQILVTVDDPNIFTTQWSGISPTGALFCPGKSEFVLRTTPMCSTKVSSMFRRLKSQISDARS